MSSQNQVIPCLSFSRKDKQSFNRARLWRESVLAASWIMFGQEAEHIWLLIVMIALWVKSIIQILEMLHLTTIMSQVTTYKFSFQFFKHLFGLRKETQRLRKQNSHFQQIYSLFASQKNNSKMQKDIIKQLPNLMGLYEIKVK